MRTRSGWLVKRGKTFYACWEVNGKRFMKTTHQTTERKAQKELSRLIEPFLVEDTVSTLANIKTAIEKGNDRLSVLDDERNPPLTLDRAWAAYERSPARPDSGESTMKQYAAELARFKKWMVKTHPSTVKDCPDRIMLRDIPAGIASEYAQDLTAAKLSPSTFNQHVKFLSLVWRVLDKEIKGGGVNPWTGIARKRINPMASRKRALTSAQFDALLEKAEKDPDVRDLLIVLAWTGLRLVDAVKLKWGAVDFARSVISVTPQKTARRTGKTVNIPMFPAVKEVLNRREGGLVHAPVRPVFPELVADYDRDEGSALAKRMGKIFEDAGMETAEKRAGQKRAVVCYGAHSLRHHFVSAASAAGIPAPMIKAITGHATDTMLEHYQQIGAGLVEEMAKRLGNGKALPAARSGRLVEADPILERLQAMTNETWKTIQEELIKELSPAASADAGM